MSYWQKARSEIDETINRHFDTPEYKRLFGVKITPKRNEVLGRHYPHYIKSRRDCWAASMAKAPLDVKRAIWEHEKDELIFDERLGAAHLTDDDMSRAVGEETLLPSARAALYGWMYLCTTRSWIESLMINHTTERKNNSELVKGGGFTQRMAMKQVADLVGSMDNLDKNTKVHMVADIDHSNMFESVFERHVTDERIARMVVRAAFDSLALDRAYRNALAVAMMEIPE
ncbi:MAG TPA: hypothetical protein VGH16_15470 [Candidatus Binatia bacterium]|jgi:hypothetical protein